MRKQVSKVIWQKAASTPVVAANAFVRRMRWAITFARGGRQTMRNAHMHRYVTMAGKVPLKSAHSIG